MLVGSLDDGTSFFPVGRGPTVVTAPGALSLGLNDGSFYGDNTGGYTAVVVPYTTAAAARAAAMGLSIGR
jgi:hypothetical protein